MAEGGTVDDEQAMAVRRPERSPEAMMADLHLSGSDPRLFPGIFTRDHASGSLRAATNTDAGAAESIRRCGEHEDIRDVESRD